MLFSDVTRILYKWNSVETCGFFSTVYPTLSQVSSFCSRLDLYIYLGRPPGSRLPLTTPSPTTLRLFFRPLPCPVMSGSLPYDPMSLSTLRRNTLKFTTFSHVKQDLTYIVLCWMFQGRPYTRITFDRKKEDKPRWGTDRERRDKYYKEDKEVT